MDLRTEERFYRHQYSTEDAVRILAAFRAVDLEPCVYVDHPDIDVFVGERPSTHPDHLKGLGSSAQPADLELIVGTVPVLMFGIMGHEAGPLAEFMQVVAGVAEAHVAGSDMYGAHSCTATPIGLSKWTGVEAYCARAGLDSTRVLAIGDGPNDCELLAGAAVAVVPADGHDVALSVADHVIGSPRDGGWAEILDLI
jgi:hydroxymethylpyrimidine pyrophosphatase-like HAD family hydrolase